MQIFEEEFDDSPNVIFVESQASHLLPAHEKLCIRSGETLQLQAPPRALASDGMAHTGVTTFVQEKGMLPCWLTQEIAGFSEFLWGRV